MKDSLIRLIEFLKAEYEMRRTREPRKRISSKWQRPIELGRELGTKLRDLMTMVSFKSVR